MSGLDIPNMFYQSLFEPVSLFERIRNQTEPAGAPGGQPTSSTQGSWLLYGLVLVLLVSALSPVTQYMTQGGNLTTLALTVPVQGVVGLLAWLLMAIVVAATAYAWTGRFHLLSFLILSALATTPWLLIGPIRLLGDNLGMLGTVLGGIMTLLVWLWSVLLFALAIQTTYRLNPPQVLIVLLTPLLMSIVWLAWVMGFVANIARLMTL